MSEESAIPLDARPKLPRGVRLTESAAHGGFVLLAPERVFKLDAVAKAILDRCDGAASLGEIVDALAVAYNAPRDRILADTTTLLAGLRDKKLLEFA